MTGPERVRRAIAREGGYEWCEQHRTYRWWGPSSCAGQHADELPRGSFVCAEHGRIHTPDEQAVYCSEHPDYCDHNVIPVRVWFRARWICVRCDRVFRGVPR